ncbi:MAG: SPOR domain-containing protein [Ignavibacteriaceae bacterium]
MMRFSNIKSGFQILHLFYYTLIILYFAGCGAVSTSDRYETIDKSKKVSEEKDKSPDKISETSDEVFNLKPFRPEINLDESEFNTDSFSELSDAWFEYESSSESIRDKIIVGTTDGFRVQVIATDDIDEANNINTEVAQLFPNHRTYVNFEPPFYKVKVGDFNANTLADDMTFKLRQMGYAESKVVRETINLFE